MGSLSKVVGAFRISLLQMENSKWAHAFAKWAPLTKHDHSLYLKRECFTKRAYHLFHPYPKLSFPTIPTNDRCMCLTPIPLTIPLAMRTKVSRLTPSQPLTSIWAPLSTKSPSFDQSFLLGPTPPALFTATMITPPNEFSIAR